MAAQRDDAELAPLLRKNAASPAQHARRGTVLPLGKLLAPAFWGCIVLVASAGMINLNKHLMQDTVFPYVFPLVTLQFGFATVLNACLMLVCPSLFESLSNAKEGSQVLLNSDLVFRRVFPVALAFMVSIVMSNLAYYYSSVPFLQMMKESNIITVYVLSLLLGMEGFNLSQAGILVLLALATAASIDGELHFSPTGLIIQGVACVADAMKNIISSWLLSGAGRKLDPMSFGFILSPFVLILAAGMFVADEVVYDMSFVEVPPLFKFYANRHLLALNACAAFVLNLSIAMFLRHSTALSFAILGIVKDILVVVSSTLLLGAPISHMQVFSFSAQILLVLAWTGMKLFPRDRGV